MLTGGPRSGTSISLQRKEIRREGLKKGKEDAEEINELKTKKFAENWLARGGASGRLRKKKGRRTPESRLWGKEKKTKWEVIPRQPDRGREKVRTWEGQKKKRGLKSKPSNSAGERRRLRLQPD